MSIGGRTAVVSPGADQGNVVPIVVIPILALVLNALILIAGSRGYSVVIPINILGGFSFNVAPLFPAATALVLGFGLWQWGGMSQGRAWLVALCIFIVPIIVSQIVNYLTGILLQHLSDAAVTNSQNFYFILFLKSAFSAASVLLVLAIADSRFRPWLIWVGLIILWAGGDTLLFGLYRNSMITRPMYQWLYPVERMLGFILLAWALQRPVRAARFG